MRDPLPDRNENRNTPTTRISAPGSNPGPDRAWEAIRGCNGDEWRTLNELHLSEETALQGTDSAEHPPGRA
ncbi:unnamed protein product [Gadus morhua 'NCC']